LIEKPSHAVADFSGEGPAQKDWVGVGPTSVERCSPVAMAGPESIRLRPSDDESMTYARFSHAWIESACVGGPARELGIANGRASAPG